jgi:hypothetical protein
MLRATQSSFIHGARQELAMTSGGSIAGSIRLSNASKLRVETVSTVNPIRFLNLPQSRQSPISGTKNPAGGYIQYEFYPPQFL